MDNIVKWPLFPVVLVLIIAAAHYFDAEGYIRAKYQEFFPPNTELTFTEFRKDLEEECPYYEPNGAAYRECLADLLTKLQQEVFMYQLDLNRSLSNDTREEFATARETFIQDLRLLGDSWAVYREQLCKAVADGYWGGSDQGGELNRCRLYETEKYRRLLVDFRETWVGS